MGSVIEGEVPLLSAVNVSGSVPNEADVRSEDALGEETWKS